VTHARDHRIGEHFDQQIDVGVAADLAAFDAARHDALPHHPVALAQPREQTLDDRIRALGNQHPEKAAAALGRPTAHVLAKALEQVGAQRPGVGVVHPDPLTSGAANWAIAAEYGAGRRAHPDDPDAGYKLLLGIWRNVVAQAASARAARTQFDLGFGDALITYEQEGLWDQARDKLHGEIVYPRCTIFTEHTLVVVKPNVAARERPMIDSLAAFLWSEPAQRMFVHNGFRSVNDELVREDSAFGRITDPFFIADLGGWKRVKKEIVDGVWRDRVLKEIDR
jgi:hypothetical protein